MTNAQHLAAEADRLGIPRRTLSDVTATLKKHAEHGNDKRMARMMLAHGRLTDEARTYVEGYLP